jgi:hypothetical protein
MGARSLLQQLEQIAGSETYGDILSGLNTGSVSEPADSTTSGSLEYDLNVIRAHLRQVKDPSSDWFAALPTYTLAYDGSTASGTLDKILTASHPDGSADYGNLLDARSVILPVDNDNSGSGYTVSGTMTGFLASITTRYADSADRRGLPIYLAADNPGTWYDEGGSDNVCRIDLLDTSTGNEFKDVADNVIFARFQDAQDAATGGTGELTDVFVKFYTSGGPYTWTAGDPTNISIVYPHRKVMSEMNEYDWFRTDFVSGFEGDVELIEDIENLWSYTGASDGVTDPTWTNTAADYPLDTNPTTLAGAIDIINTEVGDRDYTNTANHILDTDGETLTASLEKLNLGVGDRDYTDGYYLNDGEDVTTSLDALNVALWNLSQTTVSGAVKYVYTTAAKIDAETNWDLPNGTYTPFASDTQPGKNMDVYVNGQLLVADYSTAGNNDYEEVDSDTIKFHFKVKKNANITYLIRA